MYCTKTVYFFFLSPLPNNSRLGATLCVCVNIGALAPYNLYRIVVYCARVWFILPIGFSCRFVTYFHWGPRISLLFNAPPRRPILNYWRTLPPLRYTPPFYYPRRTTQQYRFFNGNLSESSPLAFARPSFLASVSRPNPDSQVCRRQPPRRRFERVPCVVHTGYQRISIETRGTISPTLYVLVSKQEISFQMSASTYYACVPADVYHGRAEGKNVRANRKTAIPTNVIVRIANVRSVIAFVYFAFSTLQTFDNTHKREQSQFVTLYKTIFTSLRYGVAP